MYPKDDKYIICPVCEGKGQIKKEWKLEVKIKKIKQLKELGFSIREIMRALNYKSPASVQHHLNNS